MEGAQFKTRSSGVIGIVVAIGVLLLLITAGTAAGMTLSSIRNNTGDTPGTGTCLPGIPDGGSDYLHTDIYTTQFSGCGKNGKCADPQDNCIGSGGINTGCSAPTKFYASLPLKSIAAKCKGSIDNCPKIQVINPENNKSLVMPVVDTGPWNINDSSYVLGSSRPQAESGTDTMGRKTNKAGLDVSPAAKEFLGGEKLNWKFTTLPMEGPNVNANTGCVQNQISGDCATKIISTARNELGRSFPFRDATAYWNTHGAWCAAFVTWVYKQSGYIKSIDGGTLSLRDNHTSELEVITVNGNINMIQPGDIFWINSSGTASGKHVGLVEYTNGNEVITIEGNVGRVGNTSLVARRKHKVSDIIWVARPKACK